jgi:hypothetical protein
MLYQSGVRGTTVWKPLEEWGKQAKGDKKKHQQQYNQDSDCTHPFLWTKQ